MEFVWVSGRVPKKPRAVCGFCAQPFSNGYLRELHSPLVYCCVEHYIAHVALAVRYIESRNRHAVLQSPAPLKLIGGPA